jgi:hypothetical protein
MQKSIEYPEFAFMKMEPSRTAESDAAGLSRLAADFDVPLGLAPLVGCPDGEEYDSFETLFEGPAVKEAPKQAIDLAARGRPTRPTMTEIDNDWFVDPAAEAA